MTTALDRWNAMTEDEKLAHCLSYAQSAKAGFLLNHEQDENFKEYCELMRAQVDWISVRLNEPPMPLYYGPGRNCARDFNDRLSIILKPDGNGDDS